MAWCYGWLPHQFVWHSEHLGNINSILLLTFPEIPSLLQSCVRKGIQLCPCGFSSRGDHAERQVPQVCPPNNAMEISWGEKHL